MESPVQRLWLTFLFIIFLFISISLAWMSLVKPDIQFAFIFKFFMLSIICTMAFGLAALMSYLKPDSIWINFMNPFSDYIPTQKIRYIFVIPLILTLIIAGTSFAGIQVLPSRDYLPLDTAGQPLELTTGETLFLSSFYPAFIEDGITLIMIGMIAIMFLAFLHFGIGLEVSPGTKIGTWIVAAIIGCIGYSWLLPGFASGHAIVQAGNQPFFISAAIFQFVNQLTFMVSGYFLPLAHAIHNAVFVLGLNYAFSFGFLVIAGALIHKEFIVPKIREDVEKNAI